MAILGLVKAIFEYTKGTEEEVSFAENELFLLFDNSDPDWWTASSLQTRITGFIPSNYFEFCPPLCSAKVIYDFDASNDEELSANEGSTVNVLDQSDADWWLVEREGCYGFIPSNYVEIQSEQTEQAVPEESAPIPIESPSDDPRKKLFAFLAQVDPQAITKSLGKPLTVTENESSKLNSWKAQEAEGAKRKGMIQIDEDFLWFIDEKSGGALYKISLNDLFNHNEPSKKSIKITFKEHAPLHFSLSKSDLPLLIKALNQIIKTRKPIIPTQMMPIKSTVEDNSNHMVIASPTSCPMNNATPKCEGNQSNEDPPLAAAMVTGSLSEESIEPEVVSNVTTLPHPKSVSQHSSSNSIKSTREEIKKIQVLLPLPSKSLHKAVENSLVTQESASVPVEQLEQSEKSQPTKTEPPALPRRDYAPLRKATSPEPPPFTTPVQSIQITEAEPSPPKIPTRPQMPKIVNVEPVDPVKMNEKSENVILPKHPIINPSHETIISASVKTVISSDPSEFSKDKPKAEQIIDKEKKIQVPPSISSPKIPPIRPIPPDIKEIIIRSEPPISSSSSSKKQSAVPEKPSLQVDGFKLPPLDDNVKKQLAHHPILQKLEDSRIETQPPKLSNPGDQIIPKSVIPQLPPLAQRPQITDQASHIMSSYSPAIPSSRQVQLPAKIDHVRSIPSSNPAIAAPLIPPSRQALQPIKTEPHRQVPRAAITSQPPSVSFIPLNPEKTEKPQSESLSFEMRWWEDVTGSYRIEARYIKFANRKVHLLKADGSSVEVPLDLLSVPDINYVKHRLMLESAESRKKAVNADAQFANLNPLRLTSGIIPNTKGPLNMTQSQSLNNNPSSIRAMSNSINTMQPSLHPGYSSASNSNTKVPMIPNVNQQIQPNVYGNSLSMNAQQPAISIPNYPSQPTMPSSYSSFTLPNSVSSVPRHSIQQQRPAYGQSDLVPIMNSMHINSQPSHVPKQHAAPQINIQAYEMLSQPITANNLDSRRISNGTANNQWNAGMMNSDPMQANMTMPASYHEIPMPSSQPIQSSFQPSFNHTLSSAFPNANQSIGNFGQNNPQMSMLQPYSSLNVSKTVRQNTQPDLFSSNLSSSNTQQLQPQAQRQNRGNAGYQTMPANLSMDQLRQLQQQQQQQQQHNINGQMIIDPRTGRPYPQQQFNNNNGYRQY